jgi:hypothetical protein
VDSLAFLAAVDWGYFEELGKAVATADCSAEAGSGKVAELEFAVDKWIASGEVVVEEDREKSHESCGVCQNHDVYHDRGCETSIGFGSFSFGCGHTTSNGSCFYYAYPFVGENHGS